MIETDEQPAVLRNWIGGRWIDCAADYADVPNPATGELLAHVPISPKEEIDRAVQAADQAFRTWKHVPVPRRARIPVPLSVAADGARR